MKPLVPALLLAFLLLCACGGGASPFVEGGARSIEIWAPAGPVAEGLVELGRAFEDQTRIGVRVETIEPGDPASIFHEARSDQTAYDLVVCEARWVGRGAAEGHFERLSDWLPAQADLGAIHPRVAAETCRVGPDGDWYAVPCVPEVLGLVWRRDWFEDEAEREAFRARFGRALGVPGTWKELRQAAQFFHRPDRGRSGCALPTAGAGDDLVLLAGAVIEAFGARWHAEDDPGRVMGKLDTPDSWLAIGALRELIELGPAGAGDLTREQALEVFASGSTALAVVGLSQVPALAERLGGRLGVAPLPTRNGKRVAPLDGLVLSLSTHVTVDRQALARRFVAWFCERGTQERWASGAGGVTADTRVLADGRFASSAPQAEALAVSLDGARGFWTLPAAEELMIVAREHLAAVVSGRVQPGEGIERLAEALQAVLASSAGAPAFR
jgi:multiple sugar transport system substrate-binding protein